MKYSIVLPIYNVETYLERCINSILQQEDIDDYEVILVDDGATDNSGKICDDYATRDARIRVVHKKNGGLSDARNVGIEMARGDYLLLIDSDDYVEKTLLKEIDRLITIHKDVDVIQFGFYRECDGIIQNESIEDKIVELTGTAIGKSYLRSEGFDHTAWNKVYRRSLFDTVRYPVGRLVEDIATTYKVLLQAEAGIVLTKKYYHYVIRSNSIMGTGSPKLRRDSFTAFRENYAFFFANQEYGPTLAAEWYIRKCLRLHAILLRSPEKAEIKQLIREVEADILDKAKYVKDKKVALYCWVFRILPWINGWYYRHYKD